MFAFKDRIIKGDEEYKLKAIDKLNANADKHFNRPARNVNEKRFPPNKI